ncbi:universal stress protein [Streptomyces telluris]|uniref:Universal stress protein n=1 Tax=Streptomyces telluris TaxID=2720021 RepID=A0A9X2LG39_9ACTN|nr:universal stress protein [Streptomyces telluris]MCQ8770508.1 universal stress protein [Streptomyces telluris]NJP78868.1 universal stress protein [Streptomyces telluris]
MVQPVSVGVDGSPESLAAAMWAGREATLRDGSLRIVHALEWPASDQQFSPGSWAQREWAESRFEALAEELLEAHPRLRISVYRVSGLPAEALLDATGESAVLALGSRGLGTLPGFLLGSVSLPVIAHASAPVVVVHPPEDPSSTDSGPVVAGLGHHDPHGPLLDFAFEAAALRGTGLRLVRTAGRTPAGDREPHDAGALAASLRPWRARWPAVEVEEWFSTGPAVPRLVEASDDAQLLVVGRREDRPFPVTRIGPVTHGVLHHARCPVAVIPGG